VNQIDRDRLRGVPLFSDLPDADLDLLGESLVEMTLEDDEVLFREGDEGRIAYVVTEGAVEVLKASDRRDVLIAVTEEGGLVGEMALLQGHPRLATVRARGKTRLLAIDKVDFDRLLDSSAAASRAVFKLLVSRTRELEEQIRQNERMAQLGTLAAGVAHELNNPAAAVKRAAEGLGSAIDADGDAVAGMWRAEVDEERAGQVVAAFHHAKEILERERPPLSALQRSDEETGVEEALASLGVPEAWALAPDAVAAGFRAEDLVELRSDLGEAAERVVRAAIADAAAKRLAAEIAEGAARVSTIALGLKSYAYLDRAPVQDVDVQRGIEDTIAILGHKLRQVTLERDFDEDLPKITALGTELNQVWTNLIDNAVDAVSEVAGGVVTVRTRPGEGTVVIEVEDNGPGIPDEIRPRIFDTFFTTKPPGSGSGLGLHIVRNIVVLEHNGDLTVESEPGRTLFRVELPVEGAG
jgi:signal transduction histidine kinase